MFYSLHKGEVLLRPQFKRLQIGVVPGQEERFRPLPLGSLSPVPYGGVLQLNALAWNLSTNFRGPEPQWLTKGYSSPYYSEVRP